MFGCVTPNLSIRLRKTSKAVFTDPVTSSSITCLTSSSSTLKLIFSLKALVPKMLGSLSLTLPLLTSSKASKNNVKNLLSLPNCATVALSIASLKTGFLDSFDKPIKISFTETCKIALIPPLRSKPRLSSLSLMSL